jgi:hypothetical protein
MKSKPTTPIPVRISDQTLKELKRIGVEQDRAVGWLIRFACDFLVNAYKKDPGVIRPTSTQAEVELLKATIAEAVGRELKAKLDRKSVVPRIKLPTLRSDRSSPKGEPVESASIVTAQSEAEMLKARIAELEAKLDLRAAVVRYDLPPSGRSTPKGVKPAAVVPPMSSSKHSAKHSAKH